MLFSIITINFNNADGLRKTLESVRSQTSKNYEHIIVDGGSTDGSVGVIHEFLQDEEYAERVTYWCSEKDKGVYDAMNKGIPHCTGDYCLFLNSGDWLVENVLARLEKEKFNEDVIYFNARLAYKKKIVEKKFPDELSMFFFYTNNLNHQNLMVKTEVQKNNLFDLKYKIASDRNFLMDLFVNQNKLFRHCNYALSYYEAESGLSSVSGLTNDEFNQINEKYFPKSVLKDLDELNWYTNGYRGILFKLRKVLEFVRKIIRGSKK